MGITVGIDLGTTYSVVAMVDAGTGRARVIPNRDGGAVTPSVVAVMPDGRVVIGDEAKELQETGEAETAAFFKRAMGDASFSMPLGNKNYSATDLSAELLRGLVEQAQEVSGLTIDHAIVTVPAYFRNAEREATLKAAEMAGLDVLGLINEPTAAAFAYGLNGSDVSQTVLVYDLGGGTFDVTLARVDGDEIRVLGSDGDHQLGGKDWDDAVVRWAADMFEEEFGVDVLDDDAAASQLAVAAENAKKRLTRSSYADITVESRGHRGRYRLTREEFDSITSFMLGQTADIVERLFASIEGGMDWSRVDGAILVGGSTRMPQVHEYIERMSGKKPLGGVNVDEAVALGAAIRANQTADGRSLLTIGGATASPSMPTLGEGTHEERMLIGGKKIVDVTAHALGMIAESPDRTRYVNTIVIPKNTPLPATQFKTVEHRVPRSGNGRMEVYMLQGEESSPLDNEVAGRYVIENIPYVEGGVTHITVAYQYNDSGVIEVYAQQDETQQELPVTHEPVPDDMSWVTRNPQDIEQEMLEQLKERFVLTYIITDAANGQNLAGSAIEIADGNGTIVLQQANLDSIFSTELAEGLYQVRIIRDGYVDYINAVELHESMDISVSLTTPLPDDQWRAVLTWGQSPRDEDSHLEASNPDYHVYFSNREAHDHGEKIAWLDVDNTTGYGPETITFKVLPHSRYSYYVHNYSGEAPLGTSGAQVALYQGNTLLKIYSIPTWWSGQDWPVFSIFQGEVMDEYAWS
ncbi:Hsp70 protein [Bifidobacterium pseudolongum subsp. globosum]|uniref:Hsp70 family protein n=1 Tax=Bifidobacterium pseudolongum TaxID=1694 RepID=UPI0010E4B2E7|nr:Hsp70 family protein [Bifidobacterium pseudolongum]RYQ18386.1 Hsp70 protein [Bifidobacterium pseudolongum subsp. globosum]